jgi:hypothetical protein
MTILNKRSLEASMHEDLTRRAVHRWEGTLRQWKTGPHREDKAETIGSHSKSCHLSFEFQMTDGEQIRHLTGNFRQMSNFSRICTFLEADPGIFLARYFFIFFLRDFIELSRLSKDSPFR